MRKNNLVHSRRVADATSRPLNLVRTGGECRSVRARDDKQTQSVAERLHFILIQLVS